MNRKSLKTIGSIFAAIIMLSVLPAFTFAQYDAPSMWLEPPVISIDTGSWSSGMSFDVVVWVNVTGYNVAGWQVNMLYDAAVLQATASVYTGTGGLKSQLMEDAVPPATTIPVAPTIDAVYNATHNQVLHGESWMSGGYGTGINTLIRVTFLILVDPPKGGVVTDYIDIDDECHPDTSKTYILDETGTEILYPDHCHGTSFEFAWQVPPSPTLGLTPTLWENDIFDNVVGWTFDVDIYLYGLSSAWYLVNASFTLNYDSALINAGPIVFNALWDVAATGTITEPPGTIDFFVETSGTPGPGDVLIATVTFTVIYQGAYPDVDETPLTFTDIVLKDHTIPIPSNPPIEGLVRIRGYQPLPMPWIEVLPASTVLGPEPSLYEEFDVDIVINDLYADWEMVGYDLRLSYCPDLLEVVSVTAGPFLDQTSYGMIRIENEVFAAASAPLWATIKYFLFKIVTQQTGTFTFTFDYSPDLLLIIGGSISDSFTIDSLTPPDMVTYALVEVRNYNLFSVTTNITCTVTPTTWGVHMAYTQDIEDYFTGSWPAYPTWWDWLNGIGAEPHHWDWMNWTVTPGSLTSITYSEISYWTNPDMYLDSGDVAYDTFMGNHEMADPDTMTEGDDPDIIGVIPWIRNTGSPPWSHTFSNVFVDGLYGPHVAIGGLLDSDDGTWDIFPEGTGVLATVRFKAMAQNPSPGLSLTCDFEIIELSLINQAAAEIPYTSLENATYTMLAYDLPGRVIDLYTQYPDPYGGQGPNAPSDMFWPQKEVILYAFVSYNWWPVQSKLVGFEIQDPRGAVWDKRSAITDAEGIAEVRFRMPWPCDDPEDLFGVWHVVATVDIACIVVEDTLDFHYDYLASIVSVDTDKIAYWHGDAIAVTVTFTSHAQQEYSVLVTASLVDELGYTVAFTSLTMLIGGAEFCTPEEYEVQLTLIIPKYAAAGLADVVVNIFDKEPADGGVPLCPEGSKEIFIEPY